MSKGNEKPILGIRPVKFVDEDRDRIDYNRAIEISEAIIRYCGNMEPWPTEWDDEMEEIAENAHRRALLNAR